MKFALAEAFLIFGLCQECYPEDPFDKKEYYFYKK